MANERLWTKELIAYFWNKIKSLVSTTASGKVDKVSGKGLSTNDYTDNDKTALQTTIPGRISAIEQAKGANGGYAELDNAGKVPSSQLPSFVDDVLEYASLGNFPLTGESGKIYIALDTNKTYRWSGSAYVEISSSLALGETSSTAYRGDRGKAAYDHAAAKGSAFTSGLYKITTNAQGHVTGATAVAKSDITGLGIPGSDTNTHRPIQVNGTEVLGNNTTALNLKAGSNVSVTNSSGTVTISATDTTYSSKTASSGGTDVSLVTTGEKYTWNNKASSDTKNTAGTTNKTGTKMFIAAATEQSANPTTYSNSNVYIGTDNCLYSGGKKVLTGHQDISGKKNTQSAVSDPSASGTSLTFISGISQNAQGVISPVKKTVATMGGASSSAAGSIGLVPKPNAGDQNKVLKGDGTWGDASSTELASVESGLAYRETGATASRNISDGEYVFWNGAMYKANGNIASGTTLVSGTNLTPTENALNALNSKPTLLGETTTFTDNTQFTVLNMSSYRYIVIVIISTQNTYGVNIVPYELFKNGNRYNTLEFYNANYYMSALVNYVSDTTVNYYTGGQNGRTKSKLQIYGM